MDEAAQRAAVVAAARTYIGTPYHHFGQKRAVGVDCATLLKLAYEEAGARPPIEIPEYSPQWHLHHEQEVYEETIVANGARETETPGIGDVVLYRVLRPAAGKPPRPYAHGAIVTDPERMRIVHASSDAKVVLEGSEREFGRLIGAQKKFFTIW